jgi:MFS family permease
MKLYLQLWNSPGLMRVVASQLLARFPYGMTVLALVMHVEHIFDSYALAGIALGAETIFSAMSGPLLGRLVGRIGIMRVFVPGSLLSITTFLLLAYTPFAEWWVVFLAALLGLVQPPIQSVARTVYPRLIKPELRSSIFALDATSQELIWILGPVIATFAAAQISTVFAMVLMAVIQAIGILLFLTDKNVRSTKIEKTEKQIGHVMKNRTVIVMVILGTVLVASFAGMEIPTVALIDKSLSGVVVAIFSLGSIIGGLTLGHRTPRRWTVPGFFLLGTVGYLLSMFDPANPAWLSICWFVGGISVAPLLGTVNAMISSATSDADALEAYGWLNTGQLLGYAGAAVIVGFLIDNVTAAAGLWVAIGFSFIGLCVSLVGIKMPQEAK